jgi:hypothetical protein
LQKYLHQRKKPYIIKQKGRGKRSKNRKQKERLENLAKVIGKLHV